MRAFAVPYIGTALAQSLYHSNLALLYSPGRVDRRQDKSRPETQAFIYGHVHKGRPFHNSIGAGGDYRRSEICKLSMKASDSRECEMNATMKMLISIVQFLNATRKIRKYDAKVMINK